MQASSLLLLPDRSIGPLHIDYLSDQALMEAFIEGLSAQSKKKFMHADGTYKDVCKWKGVKCNGRRRVTKIEWLSTNLHPLRYPLRGTLSFEALPPCISTIKIGPIEPPDPNFLVQSSVDTAAFPSSLKHFSAYNLQFYGVFDLRRIPPALLVLKAQGCKISGSCCLTALPKSFSALYFADNHLEGSISLDFLPKALIVLDLSYNMLSGTLSFHRLPRVLHSLYLTQNKFSGEINLNYLPHKLARLDLCANSLTGTFKLTRVPKDIDIYNIYGNNFQGPAIVSRAAYQSVKADFSLMGGVVDEHGVPYDESDDE